jgi:hypothetical protein
VEVTVRPTTARLEALEIALWREIVAAAPPALVAGLGLRVEPIGAGAALAAPEVDVPMFNRVLGLGVLAPADHATIERALSPWCGRAVRRMVQVVPDAETPALRAALEARGLRRLDNWVKLTRRAEPPPPIETDLRVAEIGPASAEAAGAVMAAAFGIPATSGPLLTGVIGRPAWRGYAAFDGDEPVAAALLFVHEGVGAMAGAGTLPTHRRRGAQGALMARRIRDGLAMGCRAFVSETFEETAETPNPSFRNMLRAGFELAYRRRNYVWFPD